MGVRAGRSVSAGPLHPWRQDPTVLSALIGALAIVFAAIVTGLFGLVHLRTPPEDTLTEPGGSGVVTETPASPISFESFLTRMASPELTDLQRRVFLDEQLERRVEWEGVVRTVTPAEGLGEKRFLMSLAPGTDTAAAAACWFAAEWSNDLLALRPGQRVIVSGVLASYEGTTPVLRACSLKRV